MIYFTQVSAALLLTALALLVLRARRRNAVSRAFAAQCLVFAGWVLGIAGLQSGNNLDLWFGFAFAFASFIPVAFVFFSCCYPGASSWSAPWYARMMFIIGAAFAVLSLATDLIVHEAQIGPTGLSRKAGPLYFLFALYFIVAWCVGLWIFVSKWRGACGPTRAQFHYLGAGLIGGCLGGISTNLVIPLVTGQSTYSWIGPYFSLVYVGFVAHAIIRHRIMDLRLFVHRGLTLSIGVLLSALPAGILLAIFWPRLLTNLQPSELVALLIAVGIATVLIPITRDVSSRLLDRYVYRTRANYQRTVREASRMLTKVLHLDTLLAFINTTVIRSTAVEGVALYIREGGTFRRAGAELRPDAEHFDAPLRAPIEIIAALEAAQGPLLADEVAREPGVAAGALYDRLLQVNWSLLLPVVSDDSLLAVIAVGPKLSGDAFYQQDLDLLMTLANQAGVAIKNAQLYTAVVVANEYLENIAATMESGVIAVDAGGCVAMVNRAAERLTGLTEAAKGGSASVLPACLGEPLLAAVADGQARTLPEVELPTAVPGAEGSASRPVICTVSPVRDPAGAVLGAVAVFSDLTPLKELEVERRRAERLAYFQALASGIAHEIKNPLVAIKTFAQLLPRRQSDERFLEEFGRITSRETDRIERLADRLRTLSRPSGGPRHPLDVRGPVGDAVELVRPTLQEENQTLTAVLGADPCIVLGNGAELEQLFLNLMLNAHEATPSGGGVTVEVTGTDTHVIVAVSDSGPGIPPELLERVFEPFFTTKARGSGLGLAISAGIAQAHGARLRAGNRPTGGAIFTVEFPVVPVVSAVVA
ncbi:MAG TPA: ATP-binding protein [Methylomirabilota bacterium]|nr:ATP-binding protein [Methylomirabilota bacterium]